MVRFGYFYFERRTNSGVTLVSEKGRVCKIENPWKGHPVQVIRENGKSDILYGEYLQIPTVAGEKVELNLYTN